MLISSSSVNKISVWLLLVLCSYFCVMDLLLYSRLRNYHVRPLPNATIYMPVIDCEFSPICMVTVKGLLLDHLNLYLLSPSATIVDELLQISKSWTWLTPNAISYFHVLVAIAAGKYVAKESLSHRRFGVILFLARTWLDDLDGHVARKRQNIKGERSAVGTTGYIVDGLCDALGCAALIIGLFIFLNRNSKKRNASDTGYTKLIQLPVTSSYQLPIADPLKGSHRPIVRTVLLISFHLMLTSAAWNRYIFLYQKLLENDEGVALATIDCLHAAQDVVFRSFPFWIVVFCWKFLNFHALINYLLLAIFFDRAKDYGRLTCWTLYTITVMAILLTEFHYFRASRFVHSMIALFNSATKVHVNSQRG